MKKDAEAFAQIFALQKVDKDGRLIEPAEEALAEETGGGDDSDPADPAAV